MPISKEETKNLLRGFPFTLEAHCVFFETEGEMIDLTLVDNISVDNPEEFYDEGPGDGEDQDVSIKFQYAGSREDTIEVEYPFKIGKRANFKEEMKALFKAWAQARKAALAISLKRKEKANEG